MSRKQRQMVLGEPPVPPEANPDVAWVYKGSLLLESNDGGRTFQEVPNSYNGYYSHRGGIVWTDRNVVVATHNADTYANNDTVASISLDGGQTWADGTAAGTASMNQSTKFVLLPGIGLSTTMEVSPNTFLTAYAQGGGIAGTFWHLQDGSSETNLLTNGDLESPELGYDEIASSVQDWSTGTTGSGDQSRHFDQTVVGSNVLASTGDQFASHEFDYDGDIGDVVYNYQSLGTVDEDDVGRTLLLTADGYCEPTSHIDGVPHGYVSEFQGDMQVSFRSGTTESELGTLMGTAGPVNSYDSTDNIFDYAAPVPLILAVYNLGTASYTVGAGDVGTEIFVMVATTLTSIEYDSSQGFFFAWDSAELTAVLDSITGDANGDGQVTDADYNIWADTYNSTTDLRADWNDSGDVTDADYTIWADNYGVGTSGAVPEPATLGLLLLGGLALLRRKRR